MSSTHNEEEKKEKKKEGEYEEESKPKEDEGGGRWGGWGFSSFSVLSDLQKAAEEISRNAVAVAKNAAKTISDNVPSPSDDDDDASEPDSATAAAAQQAKEEDEDRAEEEEGNNNNKSNNVLRSSALDRLENASEDTLLGQGLKALDDSVESLASGAWLALGTAWKGGSTLMHKLEHSAVNLADSIQHGTLPINAGSLAPSIIETGKSFTAKGIQVLERVSKETMEMLITETGLEVEKNHEGFDHQADEPPEEITFDRCFYIYGGPEQLEELEALSNHYALLFNRKRVKLLSEQKSFYDGKLKQIQQNLNLASEIEEDGVDPNKGKHVEMEDDASSTEMKILHDSSISKAAEIAAGFAASLGGLAMNDIVKRTTDRLETIHAEGVHRLSELCSFAVSHLLMLGKSVISNANKSSSEEAEDNFLKANWPEDSVAKAKAIRSRAQFISRDVESVANSFITGVSEIIEAYQGAMQSLSADDPQQQKNPMQDRADTISNHLRSDQATALGKIQDALQYLAYVLISTSVPAT